MSADVCHLCFEQSYQMMYNFQQNLQTADIQDFVENFCQFVFHDNACTLEDICMKCWQTLNQFNQFCDKIKGIHQNLIEVSCTTGKAIDFEEHTEVLEDEVEENDVLESADDSILPMLSIESDVGDEGDSFERRLVLTPKIIRKLEDQLKFEGRTIDPIEMDYDRMARFIAMRCCICNIAFDSLEMCHEHYLVLHGRSAYWNCCNLQLDTPYEVLDHLKYHESIDVFKCAACCKCFLTSNKLKYHIRRTHLPVEGSFQCTNCDKSCKNLRLLLNHQQSHIRVYCPHCKKIVSAANYDHHVRTAHANRAAKKRTTAEKKTTSTTKRRKDDDKPVASGSKSGRRSNLPNLPRRDTTVQNMMIQMEPNENGMFECDVCSMQFKQISLVFSHRNKVHV